MGWRVSSIAKVIDVTGSEDVLLSIFVDIYLVPQRRTMLNNYTSECYGVKWTVPFSYPSPIVHERCCKFRLRYIC